jgi:hypothetical protein
MAIRCRQAKSASGKRNLKKLGSQWRVLLEKLRICVFVSIVEFYAQNIED